MAALVYTNNPTLPRDYEDKAAHVVWLHLPGSGLQQALCGAKSVRAEPLERAVWDGAMDALGEELAELMEEHRKELLQNVGVEELERMEPQLSRLIAKMHEAQDKELEADDPARKQHYAKRAAEYELQVKLLRRRIDTFKQETKVIEVDYKLIASRIKDARKTTDPVERRQILLDWLGAKVPYANGEAVITLLVPLKRVANCEREEPHVCASNQQNLLCAARRVAS